MWLDNEFLSAFQARRFLIDDFVVNLENTLTFRTLRLHFYSFPHYTELLLFTTVRKKSPGLIVKAGFCAILKVSELFNLSVGEPTVYYYSIFQQLFNFIPLYRFEKSVKKLSGDHYKKSFSTWQQFQTCLYAQITGKDSLREIVRELVANHNRFFSSWNDCRSEIEAQRCYEPS